MSAQLPLSPGLTGNAATTVTPDLTAPALGSGEVAVYGTPAMIALIEAAAVDAVRPALADGQTSVGTLVNVQHLAATPEGVAVRATATLTEVDGRRLIFAVEAFDAHEQIGSGTHERFIVDAARFAERTTRKAP